MKKLTLFIPAAFMFIVLAVLFVFMCLPQNESVLTAQGGVMDLRGEQAGTVTPLYGQWEFIYGELLAPEDFNSQLPTLNSPLINVPASWADHGYPLNGFATYRLTILTDETKPLTIFLPEIYTAYALFINGEEVHRVGVVSSDPTEGRLRLGNTLITTNAENGIVELVFQISNYHYSDAGLRNSIFFGESSAVNSWFFRTRAFYAIALGCVLMAAFYHLTLYIYRRREKAYLIFALVCFFCFFRFIMETNGLNGFFQWIPETLNGLKIYFGLLMIHTTVIYVFMLYTFNREFLLKYKYIIAVPSLTLITLSVTIPFNAQGYELIMITLSLAGGVFALVMAARSPVLKEHRIMRLYLASFVIFLVVGTMAKLIFRNEWYMTGLLNNMFFIMAQSLVLSRRYTDAFTFAEEANEQRRCLSDQNAALENLNRMKTEFLQDIKHEVRNPLHVISYGTSYIQKSLSTGKLTDAGNEILNTMQNEAMRLGRMIDGMVELATGEWGVESGELRVESGELRVGGGYANRQKVDFSAILKSGAEAARLGLEQKGNTLHMEIEPDLPFVHAEAEQLMRVPVNLLSNAIKSTENGTITIKATTVGNYITVKITDTGEGIPADILPRVFERGVTGKGGEGYGLSICRTIVQAHGGTIGVESGELGVESGKPFWGTCVTFTVPVYGGQREGVES
jgi:signal transduction histidine kinase